MKVGDKGVEEEEQELDELDDDESEAIDEDSEDWIDWHTFFFLAICLEFRKDKADGKVKIIRDYKLTKGPISLDILLLLMERNAILENDLGRFMSPHNIIEYKSEKAALNHKALWQVASYAAYYIYQEDVDPGDVTIFLVKAGFSKKLRNWLIDHGGSITELDKGIYELHYLRIRTIYINLNEVDEEKHLLINSIREKIEPDSYGTILQKNAEENPAEENEDWNAFYYALDHIYQRAFEKFTKLRKGGDDMAVVRRSVREAMNEFWGEQLTAKFYEGLRMKSEAEQSKQKYKAEGKAEGIAEGRAEGRAEEGNKVNALYSLLLGDGRTNDIFRAFADIEYRESLYSEYAPKLAAQGISLA